MIPQHLNRLRLERLEARLAPAFLSFRAGDGFTSSDDTFIAAHLPQVSQAGSLRLDVSGAQSPDGMRQSLIRFQNLFGAGPHQIPSNATIKAATVTLYAIDANAPTVPVALNQMLMPWNPGTANWDSFVNGLQTDDTELLAQPDASQTMTGNGYQISSQQLKSALKIWQQGYPNHGWAISPATLDGQWAFASSEDPDPSRRPMLTVEFTTPDNQSPGYAELAGQPPSPLKLAWFDWSDNLRQRRLDRVPSERISTFYFAQDGDDLTGAGTIASPWKSLDKANEILLANGIDVRLRFRRGDVWRGPDTLACYSDGVTIDDYGDVNLPKPVFTRFVNVPASAWTFVGNGVYSLTGLKSVGWVRESVNPLLSVYYRAASHAETESRPLSWWYDKDGVDPISDGQPTLYVNTVNHPSTIIGGLEVCPGDGKGWLVNADNVRVQNLRIEGQGMALDGFGYGLQVLHQGVNWEFVGQGLEIYFTGYHSFGQIGQYAGTQSIVTLVDVKAGYCTNRNGDITVFVSYADWGGNEYYQYDCQVTSGMLPSSDWLAQPGMPRGQGLYTHVGAGGHMNLMLVQKTTIGHSANPVESLNNLDSGAPAPNLNDARTYLVEERASIASVWHKFGQVTINSVLDMQSTPPPYDYHQATFYYGPFSAGGWIINSTAKIDARYQINDRYEFLFTLSDSTKYINCHVDISNSNTPTYFRNPYIPASSTALGLTVTNSIISIQTPYTTGVNAINDSAHLIHNAYYLPQLSSDPALQYFGDTGAVTLSSRFAAGVAPSMLSPLNNGGVDVGLEYDQNRQPRGNRKSIGPLVGQFLPMPGQVDVRWGIQSKSLGANTVIPSHKTDSILLTFSQPVDVRLSSLQLWNETGAIAFNNFFCDQSTGVATWVLAGPLPRGHYLLELDTQPIKNFRVLPGDIDGDGNVAASDFNLFRLHFGSIGSIGDFDGDGSTDAADFLLFRQMFGSSI